MMLHVPGPTGGEEELNKSSAWALHRIESHVGLATAADGKCKPYDPEQDCLGGLDDRRPCTHPGAARGPERLPSGDLAQRYCVAAGAGRPPVRRAAGRGRWYAP